MSSVRDGLESSVVSRVLGLEPFEPVLRGVRQSGFSLRSDRDFDDEPTDEVVVIPPLASDDYLPDSLTPTERCDYLNAVVSVPPGPLCSVCLHTMCPCCGDFCDRCEDGKVCCDGRCSVDREDLQAWQTQVDQIIGNARVLIAVQLGPFLPASVRRERGIP